MSTYPESIDSAVLIGANPPGHFFWSAADVTLGFSAYQPYFAQAYPQYDGRLTLEELCAAVLEKLPRRSVGVRIDPTRIRVVTFAMLFHRDSAAYAFDAYVRAYQDGNFRGLAMMSLAYGLVVPRLFEWGDFFLKGLMTDFDPARDYSGEAEAAPGRFGSPLGEIFFAPRYPAKAIAQRDPALRLDVRTPTLILNGELDFSTPARTAREKLVDHFPEHVKMLSVPFLGHVGDFWKEPAVLSEVLDEFYRQRVVPASSPFPARPIEFRKTFGLGLLPW
jgi:pimeloyl-ACP methyl ester carboxylesterase